MGISVKGRTRNNGEKSGRVKINKCHDHFKKVNDACKSFGNAIPYLSVVVYAEGDFTGIVAPLLLIEKEYPPLSGNLNWGMYSKSIEIYKKDPKIKVFHYTSDEYKWW